MFRKRSCLLLALLFSTLSVWTGYAQETKAGSEEASAPLPSTRTLARDYPVITVEGCAKPSPAKASGGCKTVITREEFEDLVNAVNPRMTKMERRELAHNYGRMLALSNQALREGIDKKPEMIALLRYVRASALGGGTYRQVIREAAQRPEPELEKFYKEHQSAYDRYTLQRLFIPMTRQQQQPKSLEQVSAEDDQSSSEQAMKTLADQMRARAAAGEDFQVLQSEVVQQSGLPGSPGVDVVDALRGTLPQKHNQVFDLSPGTPSPVIADATGYYIYKVVSRTSPPFESVRDQVAVEFENQRTAAALKKIERMKVNDAYFDKYDPPPPNPDEPEVDDD